MTTTIYKWENHDGIFSGCGWSIEDRNGENDLIVYTPYKVEIPDGFSIGENVYGEKMFFRGDEGCELVAGRDESPYLVCSDMIRLTVIGEIA